MISRLDIAKRCSSRLRYQVRYSTALSASAFIMLSAFSVSPSSEVKLMQKYNSELAPIYDSKLNELYQMCVDRMK